MDDQASIPASLAATLQEMGVCAAPMRTFLIQKGYFVGHKYHFDGGYAMRMAGQNAIEIYDDGGQLLKTVSLEMNGGGKGRVSSRCIKARSGAALYVEE